METPHNNAPVAGVGGPIIQHHGWTTSRRPRGACWRQLTSILVMLCRASGHFVNHRMDFGMARRYRSTIRSTAHLTNMAGGVLITAIVRIRKAHPCEYVFDKSTGATTDYRRGDRSASVLILLGMAITVSRLSRRASSSSTTGSRDFMETMEKDRSGHIRLEQHTYPNLLHEPVPLAVDIAGLYPLQAARRALESQTPSGLANCRQWQLPACASIDLGILH